MGSFSISSWPGPNHSGFQGRHPLLPWVPGHCSVLGPHWPEDRPPQDTGGGLGEVGRKETQARPALHTGLLTENMAPSFIFIFQEKVIHLHTHLFFFFSSRDPVLLTHTHPPTQLSLLACCLKPCHLKVRESSKARALLLYLRESLPFGWALLS